MDAGQMCTSPTRNFRFASKFALRRLIEKLPMIRPYRALDGEMSVGLGSDIAGGYSLSIQSAMRQAVVTARLRESQRRELNADGGSLRVDWVESLYLATRGGKQALGLGGAFEVGMEFDAQLSESILMNAS